MQTLNDLTQPDDDLAESLDRDFQRASQHAAKKCRRVKQAPWSPKLAEAWAHLHFYRIANTAISTQVDISLAAQKLRNKWQSLPSEFPTDPVEIQRGYNIALSMLKTVRQEARAHRDEHLERKAAMYAALEETGKSKVLRRLIRAETQHRIYNKIKYLRNRENGTAGLTTLKIPKNIDLNATENIKELPDTLSTSNNESMDRLVPAYLSSEESGITMRDSRRSLTDHQISDHASRNSDIADNLGSQIVLRSNKARRN